MSGADYVRGYNDGRREEAERLGVHLDGAYPAPVDPFNYEFTDPYASGKMAGINSITPAAYAEYTSRVQTPAPHKGTVKHSSRDLMLGLIAVILVIFACIWVLMYGPGPSYPTAP